MPTPITHLCFACFASLNPTVSKSFAYLLRAYLLSIQRTLFVKYSKLLFVYFDYELHIIVNFVVLYFYFVVFGKT